MANFCGGIKLNSDTFEVRNGVITLVDAHSDDPIEEVNTPCSQLYDSIIFERVKHNGVWIMTSAGVDTDIPLANIVTASCGAKSYSQTGIRANFRIGRIIPLASSGLYFKNNWTEG